MKKHLLLSKILGIFAIVTLYFCLFSCGDDDSKGNSGNSSGGGLIGWYGSLNTAAKSSDFYELNKAIEAKEVLYANHIASADLFFFSDGLWNDTEWAHGRFRFFLSKTNKTGPFRAVHIINDNSLALYDACLCAKGSSSYGEAVYTFYAGYYFKDLAYYDTPSYYTYTKIDNKIYIPQAGTIFTITGNGLVEDGSSSVLTKYDPSKTY